ncbi:MAG: hypothetical protein ABSG57_00135 [Candidatus Bathyarchaeia archaeon]|jgi:hypothetical protein
MKTKHIVIVILALLMLSSATLLATVKAPATWPNLPLTTVQLTVVNGTTSYFISTLSGVPAGFDVHNGVYPGWCVDRSVTMIRSVSHNVKLYSSLPPTSVLSSINWRAINYILNHKQGNMMDVQQAIWHFTDAFSPISATAQAMVNAANANPTYDPTSGAILAVICLRQTDSGVQNSIIELGRLAGLSPGYWKHNVNVYNGGQGSYSGDPHITPAQLEAYAAYIAANFHPGFTLAWANTEFQNNAYKNMWLTIANWFNAAAGRLPYAGD